jgi:YfiR/HmsC-like
MPQLPSFQSLELCFPSSFGLSLAVTAMGVSVFYFISNLWKVFSNRFDARLRLHPECLSRSCAASEGRGIKKFTPGRILLTVLCLSLILFSFHSSIPAGAQMHAPLESRTKANFISQIPRFVDWPDTAFPSAQSPFALCLLGELSYAPALAGIMRGTLVQGRKVEIRSVVPEQDLRACHILFVTQSKRKIYGKVLEAVHSSSVLTIGETPDFVDVGGGVSLLFELEILHFEVNLAAANGAHLKISSAMLSLARRVVNIPEIAKS